MSVSVAVSIITHSACCFGRAYFVSQLGFSWANESRTELDDLANGSSCSPSNSRTTLTLECPLRDLLVWRIFSIYQTLSVVSKQYRANLV
jgi:hypothetical protein